MTSLPVQLEPVAAANLSKSQQLLKEANTLCHDIHVKLGELRVWWVTNRDDLTPVHREIVQAQLDVLHVKTIT